MRIRKHVAVKDARAAIMREYCRKKGWKRECDDKKKEVVKELGLG